MEANTDSGIVTKRSRLSVNETLEALKNALESKGVSIFAIVDHSGEAAKVGLPLRPTKLLIFGSPKAGTPLMQRAPSIAIDLPLKILIWEDESRQTWMSYNSPLYLQTRHHLPAELLHVADLRELSNAFEA